MRASAWFHRNPVTPPRVPAVTVAVRRRTGTAARTVAALAFVLLAGSPFGATRALAQRSSALPTPLPTATPKPQGFFLFRSSQKPASNSVNSTQAPAVINKEMYDTVTQENSHVIVSLSRQRAYLMTGDTVAIDSPISSGRAGHTTPNGTFHVMEKDRSHMSNIYGNYVDRSGRVVRSGISSKIDAAPAGTHYVGAPMLWFMRLTGEGVGMHVGILPGYAASHGCIRMPVDIAPLFYDKVKLGTTVVVRAD